MPVCLSPSIALRVPAGRIARVYGTTVTLFVPSMHLLRDKPCRARLRIIQPFFCNRAISCLPVMVIELPGISFYLKREYVVCLPV